MLPIEQGLYQFSAYSPAIDLSFNQYLMMSDEPILFHTGNLQQAGALIPQIKALLDGKRLAYIFVSHFEADECGGLPAILNEYPEATTICSEITARQFAGFGFRNETVHKKTGEELETASYVLQFISYPSEVHLWEGLLVYEKQRDIFFSSDLMIRRGDVAGIAEDSNWLAEIDNINAGHIPDLDRLKQLQNTLSKLHPKLVAPGHGPCLRFI